MKPILILMITMLSTEMSVLGEIPTAAQICPKCLDMSKISWGHRVNSRKLLEKYLADTTTLMLEADILTGFVDGHNSTAQPIMAHPPNVTSDLSLDDFLDIIIDFNKEGPTKGVKLDFKEIEAAKNSFKILKEKQSRINFPLWFNADVLRGPGGQMDEPVDPEEFLRSSKQMFPMATLSIGWKTQYRQDESYSKEHVEEMIELMNMFNITQPVTFPIRASLVKNSCMDNLMYLIKSVNDSTLTVWTSATDIVDMKSLVDLQLNLGLDKVYYDLPKPQMKTLYILRASAEIEELMLQLYDDM